MKLETLAVHAGRAPDPATGAVREPIHLSTTFERGPDGQYPTATSTRAAATRTAARWSRRGGARGRRRSGGVRLGSAATLAAFTLAAPGGRVVCSSDCYHGTAKQLRETLPRFGVQAEFVDTTDLDAVARALAPAPRCCGSRRPRIPCCA